MKIEVDNVKGFQDYLPPESLKREKIKEIARRIFKLYGFLPMETPIIEFDELMKSDDLANEGEDEAVSERFRLQDRGGRNLGLRYELTFPLARVLKQNPNLKMPFKRYIIGEAFRDEPTKTGRTRQFTQCDIDIIGDPSIKADAECIAAVSDLLRELKIKDIEIQVNNRKLLNSIIESVEIKAKRQVTRELDKIEKLGIDQVKSNLKKTTSPNQIITLFRLLEKDLKFFKENAFPGAEEIEELTKICKAYGVKIKFNPFLIRGFAYYTGSIFEFVTPQKRVIIAGGRFDKTVGKYLANDIPATGVSFSLEALMALCPNEIAQLKVEQYPTVLVLAINQDEEAVKLTRKLRKSNISCTLEFGRPSKALDYANSLNIPYVVFLGEEEVSQKKVKLKEMKSGEEKLLTEEQLIKKLGK